MTDRPSLAEIEKVRRHECATHGHDWIFVNALGREDPVLIICERCGRTCKVLRSVQL